MILHIDMDAFYAAIEQRDNPDVAGKCVIVGGLSGRGVVSAASYEARAFGIHSAMPMFKARQMCPHGIFVRPRMDRYKAVSKKIMSLLEEFSPQIEPVSIDEAYMDISGCERLHGKLRQLAVNIKETIKKTVNLTCSMGIGPNKFIAKIASDMNKPDGLTIIMPDQTARFLENLPIHKVPGVGETKRRQLENMGITTLGNVKTYPENVIVKKFGKFGLRLLKLSAGIDETPVVSQSRHKSVSAEETLQKDTDNKKVLNNYILKHAETVARQLRKMEVRAKTVTLKIKHSDFRIVTRRVTLPNPIQSSKSIYNAAAKLLTDYNIRLKIRLIGVGASHLVSDTVPVQMDMFEYLKNKHRNWEDVDKVVDSIGKKFGKDVIKRGTLGDPGQSND
ncbi:MAG: DNA polymerase IV [Desulfobacterales bacterium]|nr:MAG: DNA polymerase IV [Desulfobacterales bacterium]